MGNLMQRVTGPLWRERRAKDAIKEQRRKVQQLCRMFPLLEEETLQGVLEENEGDLEKTIEMFMPMCTSATRQEHQKRPPSGKASNRPRPQSASKDVKELVEWANSDDVNVQFQAARSLADLAMSDFARDAIRTAGGIPPLVKLLCSDMDEVRRCVVTAIANLALSEESQALLAQEENLLSPLISIAASVCNETDEEEMKLNVARCLANLAYCNEKVEAEVVELGCLDPLMAMCSSGSPDVRLEAMAALANLARNEGNQRKIVEQGALRHLVAVMKHPEEDEELLKQAARCLANISLNIYNEKEVKESGATQALVVALGRDSHQVKRLATMALANMCQYTSMQTEIVSQGALPVIFELLQGGQEDIELQAARCMALLSAHEENKAEIVRQGALRHFIEMARTRTQDMQILAATCLANLSTVKGVSASWG